jgi:nanoRNase/pAp phosphatase (c-di-AMP/oligoRNAs hydrolase)
MQPVAAANLAAVVEGIVGYATENPVLVLGVSLGLFVLVGGGYALYRYLTRPPVSRLRSVLREHDAVTVLMHPDPDPDAMASALAVKQLAAAVDTGSRLCYSGEIRRPENRAFETMLDLEFDHVERVDEVSDEPVVLVDHNEPRGFAGAEEIAPVAVIDHHPGGGTGTRFTDVRPDTGACATILAEYFHDLEWDFHDVDMALTDGGVDTSDVPPESLPSHVATGMIYGIQSDTRSLTNGCSGSDFSAAAYLYQGVDTDLLNRIANPQVDAEVLDVKARAITERVVDAPYAVSDVGEVSNTDAIPQAADELETLEGVSAVVVIGEKEGTIRLAGRSRDDRVHIGRVIESVVDDIPMAEGGGHARMGGGKISVKHMDGLGPGDGVERGTLETRLFEAMAGER